MILAVVQARFSSRRLPGKVLKTILNRPMLALQLERIARAKNIDEVMVATSVQSDDDPLAEMCGGLGINCFRGSLDHVLDRFYQAAASRRPDHVVRLTGDCPLIDPGVIDAVVELHLNGGYDYSSNVLPPTFPDGLDTEIMKFSVLHRARQEARLPSELEHVTPYINRHPELFRLGNLTGPEDLSGLRWTVDEEDDFELVKRIYEALYPTQPGFGYRDVLDLLQRHPDWLTLNDRFSRNEGMQKSLDADKLLTDKKNG